MKINTEAAFFIYHEPSEVTLEKLNWKQLQSLCQILHNTSAHNFFFWMQGEEDWLPLKNILHEILEFNKHRGPKAPPPPNQEPTELETNEHTVLADEIENREFTRFSKNMGFTLDISGHLVKAKSMDISITGVGFTQKVFLNNKVKYIFCYYDAGDQMLEFKAEPIYKSDRPEFSAIRIISCNNLHLWKKVVEDMA